MHDCTSYRYCLSTKCYFHIGLDNSTACSEQTCKMIGYGIRDIHACLVMVDDDLMENNMLGETGMPYLGLIKLGSKADDKLVEEASRMPKPSTFIV